MLNLNDDYESLIADMAQGEIMALESLYTLTKSAVYGFALSIVKHPQNAEDVMQDVYIKLYQSAKSYRPQGKPMAWILTITRNMSLMKFRSSKEVPLAEDYAFSEEVNFSDNSIDRIILNTALSRLGEEERQIVFLHSVSGLKHRELAQVLDLPLSTVLSKYRRALSKLKKILKEGAQ